MKYSSPKMMMWIKMHKFKSIVQFALDKYVPSKVLKDGEDRPWFNSRVRKLIRRQRELRHRFERRRNLSYKERLNEAKKRVRGGNESSVQKISKQNLINRSKQKPEEVLVLHKISKRLEILCSVSH